MNVETMTAVIVLISIAAGGVTFVAGIVSLVYDSWIEHPVRQAARQSAKDLQRSKDQLGNDSPIKAHGAGEAVNAVANLAKALKDLDQSTRLLLISLAFVAIAAAVAIGSAVSEAIGDGEAAVAASMQHEGIHVS